jgi:hypothetical protein
MQIIYMQRHQNLYSSNVLFYPEDEDIWSTKPGYVLNSLHGVITQKGMNLIFTYV